MSYTEFDLDVGDVVRTPDSMEEVDGMTGQPHTEFGTMGEIIRITDGDIKVRTQEPDPDGEHSWWWSPHDLLPPLEVGDIVRTPPMGVEKEVCAQPRNHHDETGEVVAINENGNPRVEIDGVSFLWSPHDLELVEKDEEESEDTDQVDSLDDIKVGDKVRPSFPATDWSHGSTDLREDEFYEVTEIGGSFITVSDDVGDPTSTKTWDDIAEVDKREEFDHEEKVLYRGESFTFLTDLPDGAKAIIENNDGVMKVDYDNLESIPELPVDEIAGREIEYDYDNEVFEIGCQSVPVSKVIELAEFAETVRG